jgi:hypothetical protein
MLGGRKYEIFLGIQQRNVMIFYDIMSKNMVEPDGPQMTSQYGTYELLSL